MLEIIVVKIDNEVVAIKEIKEESVIVSAVDKLNAIEVFSGTLVVIEVILVEDRDKVEVKRVDKIVVECIKPIVFVFKMNDDESVVVKVLVESDGVVKLVVTDVVDEIIVIYMIVEVLVRLVDELSVAKMVVDESVVEVMVESSGVVVTKVKVELKVDVTDVVNEVLVLIELEGFVKLVVTDDVVEGIGEFKVV